MKIKQFEIWIADLNPRMGTEAGKIRPVIVVQTDLLNKEHPNHRDNLELHFSQIARSTRNGGVILDLPI